MTAQGKDLVKVLLLAGRGLPEVGEKGEGSVVGGTPNTIQCTELFTDLHSLLNCKIYYRTFIISWEYKFYLKVYQRYLFEQYCKAEYDYCMVYKYMFIKAHSYN